MLPELAEAVREAAHVRGVTVNDYIVDLIEADLAAVTSTSPQGDGRASLVLRLALREVLAEPGALERLLAQEGERQVDTPLSA